MEQSNLSHFERHLISPEGYGQNHLAGVRDYRKPYRILSLDGGGIRSIISCAILERIVDHNPNFLSEVDFIIGTSAGGILALLLSSGYPPSECTKILKSSMPHIFGADPKRIMNPFRAKYCDKAKEEILKYYFHDRTMGSLDKACAVVSFRVDGEPSFTHAFFRKRGWRPAVFSNLPATENGLVKPDLGLEVWEAGMRTSAAPTYFPIFQGYVDGGVVANNPAVLGVTKSIVHYPGLNPNNVFVLSIGTGCWPSDESLQLGINGEFDWGLRQWVPHLLDLLLEGDSVTIDMLMNYLLGHDGGYHRIDPELSKRVTLDELDSMDQLYEVASVVDLTKTLQFCDRYFKYNDYNSSDDNMESNSLDRATSYYHAWEKSIKSNRP